MTTPLAYEVSQMGLPDLPTLLQALNNDDLTTQSSLPRRSSKLSKIEFN